MHISDFSRCQSSCKVISEDTGEMLFGLFYSNPRDWQDYNDVNEEIKDTLKSNDIKTGSSRKSRHGGMTNWLVA
jgi:hypothetical protein